MRGPAFARAQEDGSSVGCSDEPEQSVHQINPDGALHANNTALLGCWVGVDEDLAENSEECKPENGEDPVPGEGPVRLEEWNGVDKDRDRGQASDDLSVDPFAVGVCAHLASAVEVDAIKTSDGDSEHELEESKDESYEGTEHASAAGVVANEVESTHLAW